VHAPRYQLSAPPVPLTDDSRMVESWSVLCVLFPIPPRRTKLVGCRDSGMLSLAQIVHYRILVVSCNFSNVVPHAQNDLFHPTTAKERSHLPSVVSFRRKPVNFHPQSIMVCPTLTFFSLAPSETFGSLSSALFNFFHFFFSFSVHCHAKCPPRFTPCVRSVFGQNFAALQRMPPFAPA